LSSWSLQLHASLQYVFGDVRRIHAAHSKAYTLDFMNIWILAVGEPLPIENSEERLLRAGILSKMLAARGHQVTWWTSTFLHMKKRHVFETDHAVEIAPGLRMRLLHGLSYDRNVSFRRLADHWIVGRKFARLASSEPRPDVILCSFPTVELSLEAVKYGKRNDVPVVLDIRDLWPDIFLNLAPKGMQGFVKAGLYPYFSMARRALEGTSAIVAINEGFVDWGVRRAGRARTSQDRAFDMGYPDTKPSNEAIKTSRQFWRRQGLGAENIFKAIFVGNIGRQFEFEPIIEVARRMRDEPVQFVICGTGDSAETLARMTRDLPNVLLPGWVGSAEIWTLMRMSQVGLAPYHAEESFTHSLPNKSLEYLSAGLPIISSLPGALQRLLHANECGLTYANGNLDALESHLRFLISDPVNSKRMGANALALFAARFSAEHVYSEMIDYLQGVADSSSAGAVKC
jgi:glycosyltransferase involved in cell wall biosynthesis